MGMVNKKQISIKQAGFTLVEMIVTLSIMGLLMGIILTGLSSAKQRFLVRDSAQQFANMVRQTISETKNGIKVDPRCTPGATVPRECSNYVIQTIGSNEFSKHATGNGFTQVFYVSIPPLTTGTEFEAVRLGTSPYLYFTYSTSTFPLVEISGANGFGVDAAGNITIIVESKSDNSIKTNVCIYKSGAVTVQSGACI